MTTLGGTLTPKMGKSESSGVSIKIEQGVLYENNEESRYNGEESKIPTVKNEPNHQTDAENDSSSMGDDSYMHNVTHSIFQPDFEIKTEPAVDIDDRQPDEETEETTTFNLQPSHKILNNAPKIRLTPTSKLIASPNKSATDTKRRYVCPYENCTKSYGKSSHLRSHLTWHTGIKPFVCKEAGCGKGFTRSDELNRHIRTHTGEKPFECVQCTKKFSRSDHLTKHLATHSKQLAASNRALRKKNKIDKNLSPGALKTNSAIGNLPLKDNQNAEAIKSVPETESKSEITSYHLGTSTACSLKIKLEKPENTDDYAIKIPQQEIKTVPCVMIPVEQLGIKKKSNIVVKTEPGSESHTSHLNNASYGEEPDDDEIMPEANLPPLQQNPPIRSMVFKPNVTSHLKQELNNMSNSVYDPTRPFPCCHCTKNFKRQDDLNRHMRTHTGEKPFACNECDKRFMRSDHLKKHMNTHTRVR